jgi:hypothetical protein
MEPNELTPVVTIPNEVGVSAGVYDRITDPMQAIKTLGLAIFKSGIFGLDKPEQGEILAMQCMVEKKSPLELARTYHFIQGQLAIRADALLAKFHQAGGSVDWTERTDEKVKATFRKGTSSADIVADMKEYVANGTAMTTDKKTLQPCLKENWKKWPRRMLTARAISEGVRLIAPECCFGTYTVEEFDPPSSRSYNHVSKPADVSLDELINIEYRPAAVAVLRESGHLTSEQDWADISPDLAETLAKKPGPFWAAVKAKYFTL